MRKITVLLVCMISYCFVVAQKKPRAAMNAEKLAVLASVANHEKDLIAISDKIWGYAEIAMKERQSSQLLSDYAEAQGFRVTKNIAKIPTAFIAEYGSGKPIIGILGEFDALPGLSQKAQPPRSHCMKECRVMAVAIIYLVLAVWGRR
jgi:aminobenzoyl-glutamate utilization protein B